MVQALMARVYAVVELCRVSTKRRTHLRRLSELSKGKE
jgi:hypothetical protein